MQQHFVVDSSRRISFHSLVLLELEPLVQKVVSGRATRTAALDCYPEKQWWWESTRTSRIFTISVLALIAQCGD
jgi:hypothetical protein